MTKNLIWNKFAHFQFFYAGFTSISSQTLFRSIILYNLREPKLFFCGFQLYQQLHCSKLSSYAIDKKTNEPNLRKQEKPDSGPFLPNFGREKSFSWVSPLLLYIVASYHCMQFQGKTNEPNLRKQQKTQLRARFRPPIFLSFLFFFFSKIWLRQSLNIMVNYHHAQYKKANDPILRKLNDRPKVRRTRVS